jgi:hypothetical protein
MEEIKKNDGADWYAEQPQQNGHGSDSFMLRTRTPTDATKRAACFMLTKREASGKVSKVATGDFAEPQSELIARLSGSRWRPIGVSYTLYYDAPLTLAFAAE